MRIQNQPYQTIWLSSTHTHAVEVIDQKHLPHRLSTQLLHNYEDAARVIEDMTVRGAPLIGVTAAFGYWLGSLQAPNEGFLPFMDQVYQRLAITRPTAVNLHWALNRMRAEMEKENTVEAKRQLALQTAQAIKEEDIDMCRRIGQNLLPVIEAMAALKKGSPLNILTHCNAGWLACVEWGTATSAIYQAHQAGIPLHVWVDETRPRNQGASLTAFELGQEGIPHTLIADNTGGHLMQHGMVDLVITGADRVTANGDAANKIGTYLKALAAADNNIPFYIAIPLSSIDWNLTDGVAQIPIEQRNENEVKYVNGLLDDRQVEVLICPATTPAANYGFDVTPARLITGGIVTEAGICPASKLQSLY